MEQQGADAPEGPGVSMNHQHKLDQVEAQRLRLGKSSEAMSS
jgi:hypothetical protein